RCTPAMSLRAASLPTLLALAAALAAGGAWAKSSDRNQPMDLTSDASDCSVGDEGGPCVFTGNVRIVQGSLDVRAAKADVRRGGGDIRRVLLSGSPARLRQELDGGGSVEATAATVAYDPPTERAACNG